MSKELHTHLVFYDQIFPSLNYVVLFQPNELQLNKERECSLVAKSFVEVLVIEKEVIVFLYFLVVKPVLGNIECKSFQNGHAIFLGIRWLKRNLRDSMHL